jgi:hypothetical protein
MYELSPSHGRLSIYNNDSKGQAAVDVYVKLPIHFKKRKGYEYIVVINRLFKIVQ